MNIKWNIAGRDQSQPNVHLSEYVPADAFLTRSSTLSLYDIVIQHNSQTLGARFQLQSGLS